MGVCLLGVLPGGVGNVAYPIMCVPFDLSPPVDGNKAIMI